jgi:hypothetical protein
MLAGRLASIFLILSQTSFWSATNPDRLTGTMALPIFRGGGAGAIPYVMLDKMLARAPKNIGFT